MNFISEKLLNEHLNVIKDINEMIEYSEGEQEGELYKMLVQYTDEHIYQVFGKGYYTLTSRLSLIHSLYHWITDDGDYCIVRKVNERRSTINKRLGLDKEDVVHYDYSIEAGYGSDEDESCFVTVEDMIYLLNCSKEASDYYYEHKDCVEGRIEDGKRLPYLERYKKPCYQEWKSLSEKGEKYLEEKFNERWEDDES